ncbi:hypothetical protein ACH40E_28190 [Streptomyces acidicola]
MANRPLSPPSTTHWPDTADAIRSRWSTLVNERRHHLNVGSS